MKLTTEQIMCVRSLEDGRGAITPDRVVDEAKQKTSPLHELFEWDKGKAAAVYWIAQARAIIGSVTVVITNETSVMGVPIYMRDPEVHGRAQGYRSVSALRADPAQARESLVYTLRVASGHLSRALELAEPLGLSDEIDVLLERITGLQRKIRIAA